MTPPADDKTGSKRSPASRRRSKTGARRSSYAGDVARLAARLGVELRRPKLMLRAITHKSSKQELDWPSNERLEFLGDAVLGMIVATYLYRSHPDLNEGDLTKVKAVAVSESILSKVAEEIELGRYLVMSKGEEQSGGRSRASILADAVEAVLAAVYLDRGLAATRRLVLNLLADHLQAIEREDYEADYKTLLQEKIQERHRATPSYRTVDQSGPDHDRTFVAEARLASRVLGRGRGKSKKQAEQAAARDALSRLAKAEEARSRADRRTGGS